MLERPYEGAGVPRTDLSSGGRLVTGHTLKLKANETLQLSGTLGTALIIDNTTCRGTHAVSAEDLSSQQARVLRGTLIASDKLPGGLAFCDFTGKLQMGNDGTRPGHFGMRGTLEESCGSTPVEIELRDVAGLPPPPTTPATPG